MWKLERSDFVTEQEIIKLAQQNFFNLNTIPRELITKNVINAMEISNSDSYHTVLSGINPEYISREKALQLLQYDKEMYGLLTKELQSDNDILNITTNRIDKLPRSIFNNKIAINFVLDKLNTETSWAVYDIESDGLVIKRNIREKKYIVYGNGIQRMDESFRFPKEFYEQDLPNSIKLETFIVTDYIRPFFVISTDVKHLK